MEHALQAEHLVGKCAERRDRAFECQPIWPIGAGRYGAMAQPAIGVPARADGAWTNWTGELVKKDQRFAAT